MHHWTLTEITTVLWGYRFISTYWQLKVLLTAHIWTYRKHSGVKLSLESLSLNLPAVMSPSSGFSNFSRRMWFFCATKLSEKSPPSFTELPESDPPHVVVSLSRNEAPYPSLLPLYAPLWNCDCDPEIKPALYAELCPSFPKNSPLVSYTLASVRNPFTCRAANTE